MIECSSTVTILPVSFAALITNSLSSGLIVWILITLASIFSSASLSAAAKLSATHKPVAIIVKSLPSLNKTPLPISNL